MRDRKASTLSLDQTYYINEVLQKLNIARDTTKPTKSPIDSYKDLRLSLQHNVRVNKT